MSPARYIAIEGPLRVGKSSLARALAERIHARTVLDSEENPFLKDFYRGQHGSAFRAQMYFLVNRFQQLSAISSNQSQMPVVVDYLFEKDKLFAYINLNDDEVAVYDEYYRHFKEQLAPPDLVVYLKATPEVLRERIVRKNVESEAQISDEYLTEVTRAYEHFFSHYKASDVLVVDTTQVDFVKKESDLNELLDELSRPVRGTQYFLPLGT
ncbi:MAG: deoxynucleoside kinase [Acidobacteria bacterium]|nr:deoxynucleoside kinase [Acidobacteriota bacterium]